MGLLDDAIREHLELKRRRGGDPSEIERAERDALGPVRREPEPIQPALAEASEDDEHEFAPGPAGADEAYGHPSQAVGHDDFPDPYAEAPGSDPDVHDPFAQPRGALEPESEPPLSHGTVNAEPEPIARPSEPFGLRDDEDPWVAPPPAGAMPHESDEPFAAPRHDPLPETSDPAESPSRLPPGHDHLSQETAEYRLEHEGDPPREGEDPLEETPEFLQDTPDHDRLWFEQRPPRDFDFDK